MVSLRQDDVQKESPRSEYAQYIWAAIILVLIACGFILMVLYLRPAADPMVVVTGVVGPLIPTIAAVLSYMKSQETHVVVNHQLDAWKKEFARMIRAETTIQAAEEQSKIDSAVAKDKLATAIKEPRVENRKGDI